MSEQQKDETITLPIKTLAVWFIITTGASTGIQAFVPNWPPTDSRDWVQMNDKVSKLENKTSHIDIMEYRIGLLEKDCVTKGAKL